ncbi:MAG: FAD-dependent oxidoreductase, partial [Candidatus Wolfebacteria bacterium]|nr:FAD-dependent oxidoreductase [Candidatus Wolfebacteria bacterium]
MYDLIIIGGGPGGVAAGVYAARKKIKSALVTDDFGGQSFDSSEIQNWIGEKSISGYDLAKKLEEHLRSQPGVDIFENDRVLKVEKNRDGFKVLTQGGKSLDSKTILVVSGSHRKKLGVPGEKEFNGKGVVYCATCDAP